MDALIESVDRLLHAETGTLVVRLELRNFKFELDSIDLPLLRDALRESWEEYEAELDALLTLLQLFAPTRYRRGVIDVDKRINKQLDDVMNARLVKEACFNRWWRGHKRAENLRKMIKATEVEVEALEAVEKLTREDCYEPIIELARIWSNSRNRVRN